jgi:putative membrane protein
VTAPGPGQKPAGDASRPATERNRWPRWVYAAGAEPDYRFSFANERTFLAWIRTALALMAGGVAIDVIDLSVPAPLQRLGAAVLVVLGMAAASAAWVRWARAERSMRRNEPLPASGFVAFLAFAVAAVAVAVLAVVV